MGDEDISAATPFSFWSRPREERRNSKPLGEISGRGGRAEGLEQCEEGNPEIEPEGSRCPGWWVVRPNTETWQWLQVVCRPVVEVLGGATRGEVRLGIGGCRAWTCVGGREGKTKRVSGSEGSNGRLSSRAVQNSAAPCSAAERLAGPGWRLMIRPPEMWRDIWLSPAHCPLPNASSPVRALWLLASSQEHSGLSRNILGILVISILCAVYVHTWYWTVQGLE